MTQLTTGKTLAAYNIWFAAIAADVSQSSADFLFGFFSYIWSDVTQNAATAASPVR